MKRIMSLALLLCIILSACDNADTNIADIYIKEDESTFCNFEIKDEKVYIFCNIYIQNDSSREKKISLIGTFASDYKYGLLKEKQLIATTIEEPGETRLLVPPGGKLFNVVFCGNFGGNIEKQNRLLPQLEIVEIVEQLAKRDGSERQRTVLFL